MADRFSFFESYKEVFDSLNAEDTKALLNAMMEYAFCNEEPKLEGLLKAVFLAIKPHLDTSIKLSEGGKKGGKASKPFQNEKKAYKPFEEEEKACNEEEKEEEKGVEKKENYSEVINDFNDTCVSFPKVTTLSEKRKRAIRARLRKYSMNDLHKAFEICEQSDFLKGANERNWSANFDWIMNDTNIAKILDGNYLNKSSPPKTDSGLTPFQEGLGEIMYGGLKP